MKVVRTSVLIAAPADLVFDLARDVRIHSRGLAHTHEKAEPPGRTRGLLLAGDLLSLRARHFGLSWRYHARVVVCEPPDRLVDVQERGPWRSMRHEQRFVQTGAGTLLTEELCWCSPLGALGSAADTFLLRRHLRHLLLVRDAHLRMVAEQVVADSAGSVRSEESVGSVGSVEKIGPVRAAGPGGPAESVGPVGPSGTVGRAEPVSP
ncbi:MAG TPA: hypothetical protein VIS06_17325 [Mycobacteriales bacterium]|jgi:hypothetical protein